MGCHLNPMLGWEGILSTIMVSTISGLHLHNAEVKPNCRPPSPLWDAAAFGGPSMKKQTANCRSAEVLAAVALIRRYRLC